MSNFKILILIVGMLLFASSAFAGTIYLMGIGNGSPGGGGGGCSNKLDFTASCNSQYVTVI